MAITKHEVPVVHALAHLARTSPQAWSELLVRYKEFTDRGKDQLLEATNDLPRVQGRMLERASMLRLLETCKEESEKLLRK